MSEQLPTLVSGRRMCSYDDGNRYLKEMDSHFEEIRDQGFNSVVLCITEADLAQRSATYPTPPLIDKMFQLAHDHDLYPGIDPWKLGNIFGGEAVSGLGGHKLDRRGRVTHKGIARPDDPATVDMMELFFDTAARANAKYVFLDEPNFDDVSPNADIEFIDRWTERAHELDLATSVCLTSGAKLRGLGGKVAALRHVNEIATDPIYSGPNILSNLPGDHDDTVERYVGGAARTVHEIAAATGKQSAVWIQGHIINAGHERVIVRDGAHEAAKHADSVGFWAFRGGSYSNIASANPELVWQTAGVTFNELANLSTVNTFEA